MQVCLLMTIKVSSGDDKDKKNNPGAFRNSSEIIKEEPVLPKTIGKVKRKKSGATLSGNLATVKAVEMLAAAEK